MAKEGKWLQLVWTTHCIGAKEAQERLKLETRRLNGFETWRQFWSRFFYTTEPEGNWRDNMLTVELQIEGGKLRDISSGMEVRDTQIITAKIANVMRLTCSSECGIQNFGHNFKDPLAQLF